MLIHWKRVCPICGLKINVLGIRFWFEKYNYAPPGSFKCWNCGCRVFFGEAWCYLHGLVMALSMWCFGVLFSWYFPYWILGLICVDLISSLFVVFKNPGDNG